MMILQRAGSQVFQFKLFTAGLWLLIGGRSGVGVLLRARTGGARLCYNWPVASRACCQGTHQTPLLQGLQQA